MDVIDYKKFIRKNETKETFINKLMNGIYKIVKKDKNLIEKSKTFDKLSSELIDEKKQEERLNKFLIQISEGKTKLQKKLDDSLNIINTKREEVLKQLK
jgi:septal ring factor EnvC (AmiA/AmiB activator)